MKKTELTNDLFTNDLFDGMIDGKDKGTLGLVFPVANINEWYADKTSPYALVLGISQTDLEKILYYASYVIFREDGSFTVAGEKEFLEERAKNQDIDYAMGAPAIRRLIGQITKEKFQEMEKKLRKSEQEHMAAIEKLDDEIAKLCGDEGEYDYEVTGPDEEEVEMTPEQQEYMKKAQEKKVLSSELYQARITLDAVWYVRKHGTQRLVMDKLVFFPMETRLALSEEAVQNPYSVYHDISALCRRVIFRNDRCRKLQGMKCPEIIMRNEARCLQEYVDALIYNGKRGKPIVHDDGAGHALTSLTDIFLRRTPLV